jgi:hypothetical protein
VQCPNNLWAAHKTFATLFSYYVVPFLGHDGYAGAWRIENHWRRCAAHRILILLTRQTAQLILRGTLINRFNARTIQSKEAPMKDKVERLLRDTAKDLISSGSLPELDLDILSISIPTNKEFGDFSSNLAMMAAKKAKKSPREVAGIISQAIEAHSELIEKV